MPWQFGTLLTRLAPSHASIGTADLGLADGKGKRSYEKGLGAEKRRVGIDRNRVLKGILLSRKARNESVVAREVGVAYPYTITDFPERKNQYVHP